MCENNPAMTDNLIVERATKPIKDATRDELLSARAHAWHQFFDSKDVKPFGMSKADYNLEIATLKEGFGIFAIEDELFERGIDPKDKDFNRVQASFDLS